MDASSRERQDLALTLIQKTGPSTGRKPLEIDCTSIVVIGASILETDMSLQKGFGFLQHNNDVFGQAQFEKEQLSNIYQVSIYFSTKEGSCKAAC